jgi:hypothetical protein
VAAVGATGAASGATDAQVADVGNQVCNLRLDGGSQADVIRASASAGAASRVGMTAGKMVRTAEKDICPAQYVRPPAAVLLRLSGSGIQNSAPFTVNSGTLTVTYSYDCSSFGSSGNFIADLETADQSDDQSIANALGSGGTTTTTIYPQDVGASYHLSVNSECDWTVVIKTAG